jgi:hypothetical protein
MEIAVHYQLTFNHVVLYLENIVGFVLLQMKMIFPLVGYHHVVVVVQRNGFIKNVFKDGLMKNNRDQAEVNYSFLYFIKTIRFYLVKVACPQCNTEYIIVYPKQGKIYPKYKKNFYAKV